MLTHLIKIVNMVTITPAKHRLPIVNANNPKMKLPDVP